MNLAFANPAILGALALAALPLIIHLISRRIARDQRFAALAFVRLASKRRSRTIRLRQLLLLLLRSLLIVVMALAMGQLYLHPKVAPMAKITGRSLTICLDVSASMQARSPDGKHSLFELAKDKAQQQLRKLDPALPAWLIVAGSTLQPLIPEPSLDHRHLLKQLDEVKVSLGTSDLGACVRRVLSQSQSQNKSIPQRIVVISDGAADAWSSRPGEGQAEIELLRVPDDKAAQIKNYALGVPVLSPSTSRNRAIDLSVPISYSAAEASSDPVAISLQLDDHELSVVTAAPSPNSHSIKRFMQVQLPDDKAHGVLQLSIGTDRLRLDNRVFVPVELPRRLRVLVVDGDPQTVHYRDEVFYLDRALREAHPGSAPLKIMLRNAGQISAADVDNQDVIILANVARIPQNVVQTLLLAVQHGAGLLITAGDNIDADYYNAAFAKLLPARLRGQKNDVSLEQPGQIKNQSLSVVDPHHPLMRALGAQPGLGRAKSHSVLLIEPDPGVERVDILRFSGGTPALCERRAGQGRVMLLATSIDRDWSDLAIRPGFLPLVQQIVVYLANAIQTKKQRNYLIGETVNLPKLEETRALIVTTPSGKKQRIVLSESDKPVFKETQELGLYKVSAELDSDSTRPLADWRFVVHLDPKESDTRLIDSQNFAKRLPRGLSLRKNMPAQHQNKPLWPYLLLLLVLLFPFESWLTWKKR